MLSTTLHPSLSVAVALCLSLAAAPTANAQGWKSDADDPAPGPQDGVMLLPEESAQRGLTLERLDAVDWAGWEDLSGLLGDIHTRTGIPGLAAAFVGGGELVDHATVGVQSFGRETPLAPAARFHLGSVTKSFTALLVGVLVERGELDWDTTVGEALGDFQMREEYRGVTLEQLLQHRGGLPAYTHGRPAGHSQDIVYTGTPRERRAGFLADVLMQPPAASPGSAMLYSNAGYALAGHMAERATGLAWEDLVRRSIFTPLEMSSAGFGFPDQPLGHVGAGPQFIPLPNDAYPPLEIIAPAGNIHCSVADLARYARAHLAGLAGRDGIVKAATIRRLHTPPSSGGVAYAAGWRIGALPSGAPEHWHGGTVAASYAELRLYPRTGSAVIVLTTVSSGLGETLAAQLGRALRERHLPDVPPSGGVTAPAGYVSQGDGGEQIQIEKQASTPEQDARFWSVIRGLSDAFNNEDRAAYRALFAASYDLADADSMFDFMARGVLPKRGGLHSFHEPSPPLIVGDATRPMRMVTFHLENGYPGFFGFTPDEAGKIEEFSLFVKSDLCPHGTDRRCPLSVKLAGELE